MHPHWGYLVQTCGGMPTQWLWDGVKYAAPGGSLGGIFTSTAFSVPSKSGYCRKPATVTWEDSGLFHEDVSSETKSGNKGRHLLIVAAFWGDKTCPITMVWGWPLHIQFYICTPVKREERHAILVCRGGAWPSLNSSSDKSFDVSVDDQHVLFSLRRVQSKLKLSNFIVIKPSTFSIWSAQWRFWLKGHPNWNLIEPGFLMLRAVGLAETTTFLSRVKWWSWHSNAHASSSINALRVWTIPRQMGKASCWSLLLRKKLHS